MIKLKKFLRFEWFCTLLQIHRAFMNQINAIIKETIERVPLPLLLLEDIARNLVPIRGPSPEPYCASTVAFSLQNCDKFQSFISWTSQVMLVAKNPPANARNTRHRFDPWVGNIPWRRDRLPIPVFLGFPCGSVGRESACNAGDLGSIPGLGRSPGEGKGYSL